MKVISVSKKKFKELKKINLSREILNTEGIIYEFNYKGANKIVKTLYNLNGPIFANKLYTLEMLDNNIQYLPSSFYCPDYLFSVEDEIKGFTVPKINGINLSTILRTNNIDCKEQLYYLKQIGNILQQLHNIRKYTPLKDLYLNDLHESNFIVDMYNKELKVFDLDSCKICNNRPFASKYLTSKSLASNSKKYKVNTDESSNAYIVADENSDLYCYSMIILNYLFSGNVGNMPIEEFYNYLNYLDYVGINKNLLDIFNKLVANCDNKNPMFYLESITNEQIYRAKEIVYNKVKNR